MVGIHHIFGGEGDRVFLLLPGCAWAASERERRAGPGFILTDVWERLPADQALAACGPSCKAACGPSCKPACRSSRNRSRKPAEKESADSWHRACILFNDLLKKGIDESLIL